MSRWIIVSNRLPFSIDQKTQRLQQSSGGLVTAINGIQTKEHIHWIGSLAPGIKKKSYIKL
jgi:trehalose-6-phosphate synthase